MDFLTEDFVSHFCPTISTQQKFLKYLLEPDEIIFILIRFPELFQNIDSAIEYLITAEIHKISLDQSYELFEKINQNLEIYHSLLDRRNYQTPPSLHNFIKIKRIEQIKVKQNDEYDPFSIVHISNFLFLIVRQKYVIRSPLIDSNTLNINQYFSIFQWYLQQSNFSPISPEIINHNTSLFVGHPADSSNIKLRSIVSDGKYLFVLSSNYLLSTFLIFPENGGITAPITRKLQIRNDFDFISVSTQGLIVATKKTNYLISPNQFISGNSNNQYKTVPTPSILENAFFLTSDGIVNVYIAFDKKHKLEKDPKSPFFFIVHSILTEQIIIVTKIRTTELEVKSIDDFLNHPSETNGVIISFYIQQKPGVLLCRQFSLLNGFLLRDFFLPQNDILAITYDSINQMHYAAIRSNGSVQIHAFQGQFSSSLNPALFGFSISLYSDILDKEQSKLWRLKLDSISDENQQFEHQFILLLSVILLSSMFLKYDINTFLIPDIVYVLTIPEFMIQIAESIKQPIQKDTDYYISLHILQILSILFVININHLQKKTQQVKESILRLLLELIKIQQTFSFNLAIYIFVNLFDFVDFEIQSNLSNTFQSILIALLKSTPLQLFRFINHAIFQNQKKISQISFVDLKNPFTKYLSLPYQTVHPHIIQFLLSHQHCITNEVYRSMKDNMFSAATIIIINPNSQTDNKSLNIFCEYTNFLVNQFSIAFGAVESFEELHKLTIYFLFDNYMSLISSLYNYHEIAQTVAPLFSIVQNTFKGFLIRTKNSVETDKLARDFVIKLANVFGLFLATLIKGGSYSTFDEKYKWLIRSNMELNRHPERLQKINNDIFEISDCIDKKVQKYLTSMNKTVDISNSTSFVIEDKIIMDNIYKTFNPLQNKNLNSNLRELDFLFFLSEISHLNLYQALENNDLIALKPALTQMIRVRNFVRSSQQLHQNDQITIDLIKSKIKMLFRMKSSFDKSNRGTAPKLLADFVLSAEKPNTFINYISNQSTRLELTSIGFFLLETSYSLMVDDLFIHLIDIILSIVIDNFDGLSSMVQYDYSHICDEAISNFVKNATKNHDLQFLPLLIFKLIRSQILPSKSISQLITIFLPNMMIDYKLFGLFYNQIGFIDDIFNDENILIDFNKTLTQKVTLNTIDANDLINLSTNEWILISKAVIIQPLPKSLFDKLFNFFLTTDSIHLPFISNCIYATLSKHSDQLNPKKIFMILLTALGESLISNQSFGKSSQIILLLRKIIILQSDVSFILTDLFNSYQYKSKEIDQRILCAIFAILGGFVDVDDPNQVFIYHQNRKKYRKGILLPNSRFVSYPVTEASKSKPINKANIYPQSLIPFEWTMYPNFQFIVSFLPYMCTNITNQPLSSLYFTSLSCYLKNDDIFDVLSKEDVELLFSKIAPIMNPIETIYYIGHLISNLKDKQKVDQFNDFAVMSSNSMTTYISPILQPWIINVAIKAKNGKFDGFFGIISDFPLATTQLPYLFIESITGKVYPNCIRLNLNNRLEFTIDPSRNCITINDKLIMIEKPQKSIINYRIFVCVKNKYTIESINVSAPSKSKQSYVFQSNPTSIFHKFIPKCNDELLIDCPQMLLNKSEIELLRILQSDIEGSELCSSVNNSCVAAIPPISMNVEACLFQFEKADKISQNMINWIMNHIYMYLTSQISTVIVMRLINTSYRYLLYQSNEPILLFSLLQIPIEHYDATKLTQGQFPFQLNQSITSDSYLTDLNQQIDDIQDEMHTCLQNIVFDSEMKFDKLFISNLKSYIHKMMQTPEIHLLRQILMNNVLIFNPLFSKSSNKQIDFSSADIYDQCIVASPYFDKNSTISPLVINKNTIIPFPIIIDSSSKTNCDSQHKLIIPISQFKEKKMAFSIMKINKFNNNWVYGTCFQLILLLKEYFLMTSDFLFVKQILIDLLCIQSPFISPFLPDLISRYVAPYRLFKNQCSTEYLTSLILLAMHSSSNEYASELLFQEKSSLLSLNQEKLAPYFPEFYPDTTVFRKCLNQKRMVIMLPHLDIIQSQINCKSLFFLCKSILKHGNTLIGFPYFEVLPLWILFSFDDAENGQEYSFDPIQIHDDFVNDMNIFIYQWKLQDTTSILSIIPPYLFEQPKFLPLSDLVTNCDLPLISKFPLRLTLIVTFVLHQLNFLNNNFKMKIGLDLWKSVDDFICLEDAMNSFLLSLVSSKAPRNFLIIDRHKAHSLIVEEQGNQKDTIISQIAEHFRQIKTNQLQQHEIPWEVKYVNESAVDLGGPAKELFAEIATSIFEPTSGLFILSLNGQNNVGSGYRDVYIPFVNPSLFKQRYPKIVQEPDKNSMYYAIGQFIGIVIRTGFYQDLPFAPIVWKMIANQEISEDDVTIIDERLSILIQNLRKAKNDLNFFNQQFNSHDFKLTWTYENWDGSKMVFINPTSSKYVTQPNIERFISSIIRKRIYHLKTATSQIQAGFYDNIGFTEHPFMNDRVISLLAQGSNVITISQFKEIFVFPQNSAISKDTVGYNSFWGAVERMNNRERSLLLKFITTFSRIPKPNSTGAFRIYVQLAQPENEELLPLAATCFNKFFLPKYKSVDIAYKMIKLAIENCQTMEVV